MMMCRKYNFLFVFLIVFFFTYQTAGQQKQLYTGIQDAIMSSRLLRGNPGPQNVDWIDNGERYSYTVKNDSTKHNEIREFDPRTLYDKLILDVDELSFPSSGKTFVYD